MTDSRDQSPVRRPVVVTAILLVALAVMLVALRSWLDGPVAALDVSEEPAPVALAFEPEPVAEPAVEVEPQPTAAVEVPAVVTPEPVKVIVLPIRSESGDPAAEAFLHSVRGAMLRALYGRGIEVIDVSAGEFAAVVPPDAGHLADDRLVYLAIRHRYGGLNVAEIFEESSADSPWWSISLEVVRNRGTARTGTSVGKNGDPRPENAPENIGIGFAETLSRNTTRESFAAAGTAGAELVLLDPIRSDQERLQSLRLLQEVGLNSAALAAAADLGTRSPSAATRRAVWTALRRAVYDPVLAQPLSIALLSDADAGVRAQAALALGAYLRESGVSSVLAQAQRNDSSPEVQLAARMSMLAYEERQTFTRETLLDRNLPPVERFAPTLMAGSAEPSSYAAYGTAAAEEALAYAEIAAGTDDPELKVRALSALQTASMGANLGGVRPDARIDPTITRVLIESAGHENERVRRSALTALTLHYRTARTLPRWLTEPEELEIRAAFETVMREQPALATDLRIEETLRTR